MTWIRSSSKKYSSSLLRLAIEPTVLMTAPGKRDMLAFRMLNHNKDANILEAVIFPPKHEYKTNEIEIKEAPKRIFFLREEEDEERRGAHTSSFATKTMDASFRRRLARG